MLFPACRAFAAVLRCFSDAATDLWMRTNLPMIKPVQKIENGKCSPTSPSAGGLFLVCYASSEGDVGWITPTTGRRPVCTKEQTRLPPLAGFLRPCLRLPPAAVRVAPGPQHVRSDTS